MAVMQTKEKQMTEIEKRLTGALQWLVDDRNEASVANAMQVIAIVEKKRLFEAQVLTDAELTTVGGSWCNMPPPVPF